MAKPTTFDEILDLLSSQPDAELSAEMEAFLDKLIGQARGKIKTNHAFTRLLTLMVRCCEVNPDKSDQVIALFPRLFASKRARLDDRADVQAWDGATCASILYLAEASGTDVPTNPDRRTTLTQLAFVLVDRLLECMATSESTTEVEFCGGVLKRALKMLESPVQDSAGLSGVDSARLLDGAVHFLNDTHPPAETQNWDELKSLLETVIVQAITDGPAIRREAVPDAYKMLRQHWRNNTKDSDRLWWLLEFVADHSDHRELLDSIGISGLAYYWSHLIPDTALGVRFWDIVKSNIRDDLDRVIVFETILTFWLKDSYSYHYVSLLVRFLDENRNHPEVLGHVGLNGLVEIFGCARLDTTQQEILLDLIDRQMTDRKGSDAVPYVHLPYMFDALSSC